MQDVLPRSARAAALIAVLTLILPGSAGAQVNVATYHNDNARTGLTPMSCCFRLPM
jgi:hypothetical protein